jgi:hypothetical protein
MTIFEQIILIILIGLIFAAGCIVYQLIKIKKKLDWLIKEYSQFYGWDYSSLYPSVFKEFTIDLRERNK